MALSASPPVYPGLLAPQSGERPGHCVHQGAAELSQSAGLDKHPTGLSLNSVDSSIPVSGACRRETSGPHASCSLEPINREARQSL